MLSALRARLTYANVMATVAVFVALGGSSYAAITVTGRNVPKDALTGADIKNLTGKDVRNNSLTGADVKRIRSADVSDRSLLAQDFAPGQLPTGAQGPQGTPGATNVQVRFSGQGTAGPGTPPSGATGGNGGNASCEETGCLLAKGGAGGDGGNSGSGGSGGSATCGASPGCSAQGGNGGAGGSSGSIAQSGEGAVVGLRASCESGERAVGGGPSASTRDAVVYISRPATTGSTAPPDAGVTPTAWYVEAYNQSRPGENRAGVDVSVRAYVVCAAT